MEANDFIIIVRKLAIDDNLAAYRELFDKTGQASDPYWKEALSLFKALDAAQRDILYKIIRQVEVDTVSTMLGVLDGTTYLNDDSVSLRLLADDDTRPISGELQDIFLEMEEDS